MTRLLTVLLIAPLALLLAACPTRPRPLHQPQVIIAYGAYTHEKSGMTFPIAVGEFHRAGIQRYDQDGQDISVGYNLLDDRRQIIATVYVYPAPPLVSIGSPPETVASVRTHLSKQEFETRKREVLQPRPGARLIEDTDISIPVGGIVRTGRMATFEYDEHFLGKKQSLRSHLFLFNFVGGKWAIKFRISYPSHLEVTREIDSVLQGALWNVPQE
ncbi:MAG: hypothetical protein IT389_09430 [Nitrospira sp.]|nr:hypothetical protein [Nitrospira sp.]